MSGGWVSKRSDSTRPPEPVKPAAAALRSGFSIDTPSSRGHHVHENMAISPPRGTPVELFMLVQMKVRGLLFDPRGNMYIVVLEDETRTLPIWVGIPEANAIALELEKVLTPRPMTHDLMRNILESLSVSVQKIVVADLRDNTYFATITLNRNGESVDVDSRPSDAIALALRTAAPIYVDEVVLKMQSIESLDEWLKNVKPEDFGKFNA